MLKLYRKGTYQSRSQSSQKRVCPITPSFRFPLQAGRTEPTRPTRFPSRSGGNLKEGGNRKLCPCDWYKWTRVRSALTRVRSALTRVRSALTRARSALTRVWSELTRVRSALTRARSALTRVWSELTRVRSALIPIAEPMFARKRQLTTPSFRFPSRSVGNLTPRGCTFVFSTPVGGESGGFAGRKWIFFDEPYPMRRRYDATDGD
jgi:hypothetical protein